MATYPTPFRTAKGQPIPGTKTPTSSNPFMEKAPKDIEGNRKKLERPSSGSNPLDRIVSGSVYIPPEASASLSDPGAKEQQPQGNSN